MPFSCYDVDLLVNKDFELQRVNYILSDWDFVSDKLGDLLPP